MRVLGIDPGTAATGFGVIEVEGSRMRALDLGVITTAARTPLEQRLAAIQQRVVGLIDQHHPDEVALEALYVGGTPRTVLSVGHARGAVLASCGCAGLPATGYPPAEVKTAVCGYGRAEKEQVRRMVGALLHAGLSAEKDHPTDALAVAICHSVRRPSARLQAAVR